MPWEVGLYGQLGSGNGGEILLPAAFHVVFVKDGQVESGCFDKNNFTSNPYGQVTNDNVISEAEGWLLLKGHGKAAMIAVVTTRVGEVPDLSQFTYVEKAPPE